MFSLYACVFGTDLKSKMAEYPELKYKNVVFVLLFINNNLSFEFKVLSNFQINLVFKLKIQNLEWRPIFDICFTEWSRNICLVHLIILNRVVDIGLYIQASRIELPYNLVNCWYIHWHLWILFIERNIERSNKHAKQKKYININ